MISNYHVDLWEHASKLYHLNHWQQAADIFEFLGKDIENPVERTKCLVNKALVEARLEDYQKAALTLADAAEIEEDLPITAFIAGLVNCEISQLALAEAWFEACLTGLNDGDVDHRYERLAFTLERDTVRHNLESTSQAFRAQELGFDDAAPDDLCYLPAELIFEAPLRSGEPSPEGDAFPLESAVEDTAGAEMSAMDKDNPSKRRSVLSHVPDSPYSVVSFDRDRDSLAPLICDDFLVSPEKISFESEPTSPAAAPQQNSKHTPIGIDPSKALDPPAQLSPAAVAKELRALERIRLRSGAQHGVQNSPEYPKTKVPYTWHGQQRRTFEPRDARGVSDSTRELARFVQDFAPEGSFPVRKIVNKDPWAVLDDDFERSADAQAAVKEYDKLTRMGATPDTGREQHETAKQRECGSPIYSPRSSGNEARPSTPVSVALRARGNSLLRSLRSSKESAKPQSPRSKPHKIRWPFQDDPDEDDSPIPASAPTSAPTSTLGPVKPVALDFIMGPDGKTIVIEKAPQTAAAALQILKEAREVPLPSPSPSPAEEQSPSFPSPPWSGKHKEPESLLLQPAVYEPPSWRKRKPVSSPTETGSPVSPPAPLRPRRPTGDDSPFFSPSSPTPVDTITNSVSPDLLGSPRRVGSVVSSPISVVSSVNIMDYLLDKVKPERSGKKAAGRK